MAISLVSLILSESMLHMVIYDNFTTIHLAHYCHIPVLVLGVVQARVCCWLMHYFKDNQAWLEYVRIYHQWLSYFTLELGCWGRIVEPDNTMLTVSHPAFISQYFAFVYPTLSPYQQQAIKNYATKHKNIILNYCKGLDHMFEYSIQK
jgi:hypothetical protein